MGDLEQFEDLLLRSARNGDVKTVEELIKAKNDGKVDLDINCKGLFENELFLDICLSVAKAK